MSWNWWRRWWWWWLYLPACRLPSVALKRFFRLHLHDSRSRYKTLLISLSISLLFIYSQKTRKIWDIKHNRNRQWQADWETERHKEQQKDMIIYYKNCDTETDRTRYTETESDRDIQRKRQKEIERARHREIENDKERQREPGTQWARDRQR